MPALSLEYATAQSDRQPWRPILFKPSRLSLILFLFVAATAAWLTRRHQPWVYSATFTTAHPDYRTPLAKLLFTSENQLLVCDSSARLLDPITGKLLREIPSLDGVFGPPVLPFDQGKQVLLLARHDRGVDAHLFDVQSGRELRIIPLSNDNVDSFAPIIASPTGHRFLVRETFRPDPGSNLHDAAIFVWDLDTPLAPRQPLHPVGALPLYKGNAVFSADGRRIAVFHQSTPYVSGFGVFDAATAKPLFTPNEEIFPVVEGVFTPDCTRLVIRGDSPYYSIRIIDAATGKSVARASIPSGYSLRRYAVSPDASQAAIESTKYVLSLIDVRSAAVKPIHRPLGDQQNTPLAFFPDNRRLFAPGPEPFTMAIYDTPSLRPLAILRDQTNVHASIAISPDAEFLAIHEVANDITFYRKTGPDCPESPFGPLGFPHTWLLILFTLALAFSLRRDARNAASDLTPPIARFALLLFLLTLPRALHVLISTCIGEPFLTPVPLLLLAAIGLATGSRFWRLATLALLAAVLPIDLYCLFLIKKTGLSASTPTLILDRTYTIPHLAVFLILLFFTALIPYGLYLLSRRQTAQS